MPEPRPARTRNKIAIVMISVFMSFPFMFLLQKVRHQGRPPCLMRRPETLARLPMEILVKKQEVFPVGVPLEGTVLGKDGAQSPAVPPENIDQLLRDEI